MQSFRDEMMKLSREERKEKFKTLNPEQQAKIKEIRDKRKQKRDSQLQDDVDLFDLVKGHLMDEGLSEQEALEKMLVLTAEERTEIIEGSCGSKKKKSKKKGY